MFEFPLQSFDLETLSAARQASESVTVIIGVAISYIAYRGYRRNGSRPMLFVAVGFVLITGIPGVATVLLYLLLDIPAPIVNSLVQVSEITGMASILYGLWTPRQE